MYIDAFISSPFSFIIQYNEMKIQFKFIILPIVFVA